MHSAVFIVISLILILIEVFFYKRLKPKISKVKSGAIENFIIRLICTQWLVLFAMLVSVFRFFHSTDINTQYHAQVIAGVILAMLLSKIIFILFDLFAQRWSWIPAVIVFFSFIYGMVFGRFNFEKKEYTVELNKEAFKDYKIIHLTDFHSVSLRSASMKRHMTLADMINSEDADLIVFTGDIVTLTSAELDDFVCFFSNLKSKDGKLAILGNHDYGDYYKWNSKQERDANLESLKQKIKKCGFNLLCNENVKIYRGGDSLCVVGIENWGRPPFPQYSDIKTAEAGISQDEPAILLSHDPDYWQYQLGKDSDHNYPLTLSGHTHAMQIGVQYGDRGFSPSSWKFDCWFGEYKNGKQTLIVSKGVGGSGIPFRLGMSPEYGVIRIK